MAPVPLFAPFAYKGLTGGGLPLGLTAAGAGFVSDEGMLPISDEALAGPGPFDVGGVEPASHYFGPSYTLLERQRPDVASLARFAHRVEIATYHMCAAFEFAGVRFQIEVERPPRAALSWFAWLAETTFHRFRTLRRALMHDWTPPAEVEPLTYSAFHSLCDLTPAAGHHLKQLFFSRRTQAIEALVSQLDLIAKLHQEAIALASNAEDVLSDHSAEQAAARLASTQAEILGRAGEALGLREAAARLGMSHQNLHKRIGTGSALGVMRGRELVVPSVQFVPAGDGEKIVPNLRSVLQLFEEARAGSWSALQFLVEQDPSLGAVPIEALKAGALEAVVASARAYLGLDES